MAKPANHIKSILMFTAGVLIAPPLIYAQSGNDARGDQQLEEIVVTGSFIKRSAFDDVGSPIDVVDRDAFEADAPTGRLTDVLRYLPQNVGEFQSQNQAFASVTNFGGGTVDLRGLGSAATLLLLNGRRQVKFALADNGLVDVNGLLPGIMVERVEVLNDGASAVYGSDAIAGVANFITRRDFDGAEIRLDGRGTLGTPDDAFSHSNFTVGALLGSSLGEDVHVVAGFEYFSQEALRYGDLNVPFGNVPMQGASGFGMPGSYNIPLRDANGVLDGTSTGLTPDLDCQRVVDENVTTYADFRTDTFVSSDNRCRLAFQVTPIAQDEKSWNARSEVSWDISDALTFRGGFGFFHSEMYGESQSTLPVISGTLLVPGEHPGNPYRAVDANGAPLFAADADGDGIPDRDASNVVILAAIPTDPASGIAFNEDVVGLFRPASTTNFGPGEVTNVNTTLRLDASLEGEIGENWNWEAGWTWSQQDLELPFAESIFDEIIEGLNGRGGLTGDRYFNPFGSQLFVQPGDPLHNSSDVFDRILAKVTNEYETRLWSVDALITGDLFDAPAGLVQFAGGVQYREESLAQDFDNLITSGAVSFAGNGERDFEGETDVVSVFVEFAVPLMNTEAGSLSLSVAGRYEEQDSGESSTNPKLSVLWQSDLLDIRASASSSFLAPSLFQLFGVTSTNLFVIDPLLNESVQVQTRRIGNLNLESQESDSFNVGFTVNPTDTLSFSLDYWSFDFTGLLSAPSAQGLLDANPLDPRITRDNSGSVVRIDLPFFNAGSLEAAGIDWSLNYAIPGDQYGNFVIGADFTHNLTYDIQESATGPVIDGVGTDNNGNVGVPIAEVRGNVRLGWDSGQHSALLTARYHSDVDRTAQGSTQTADAEALLDAQYSYTFGDGDIVATFGALNLLDEEPNKLTNTSNAVWIRNVQDPRGRMVHASLKWNF